MKCDDTPDGVIGPPSPAGGDSPAPQTANPAYAAFHSPRFTFLIDIVRPYARRPGVRILDVGPSPLTQLLSRELRVPVESLGLESAEVDCGPSRPRHYSFDLNDAQYRERWRTDFGLYDIIVVAEVIEHLYTAPDLVLLYLKQLLVPGGVLLLQTPNAVSLRKRLKLALGLNPFERIRLDRSNPGHFREYTLAELCDILAGTGFTVEQSWMKYYFDAAYERHERGDEQPTKLKGGIKNFLYRLLPPSLQEGITIVARAREL